MRTSTATEKHSVSMPAATSEDVRARVGSRGFSAYVSNAVARQLERDALDDVLARMEAEHGPVDDDEITAIMGRLAE
ncbi:MAG: CopG family transcriptional regulator [Micrococcales bacterium]|nr:CopG family transcriptional regulator [Micrococcales bacterium]